MSASVALQESQTGWVVPPAKPLDEAVWQAWLRKGSTQDWRGRAVRLQTIKWASIVGLLFAAAGVWSYLAPYEVVVRFGLAAGAMVVMLQAFHARRYAFATVFASLALLYNPVAPVFNFSGAWESAVVVTSAVPFAASLAWRDVKLAHNG